MTADSSWPVRGRSHLGSIRKQEDAVPARS